MDGYLTRQRSMTEVAREYIRQAHVSLYRACDCQSMVADKLITDARVALVKAAALLTGDLAERAIALVGECSETLRGSLGYVITLEQRCGELHDELCAAVASGRTPLAAE